MLPAFLKKTTIKTKQQLMYYISAMNFMFVYTILAYSIAIFLMERFPENQNAIFLVGLILGISSFFALFVDSIWSYAQKVSSSRKLLLMAIIGLIITVSIFLGSNLGVASPLAWPLFTVIAAFSYGWSYDLYEVTMTTVILNKGKKSKMAQEFSQKKVAESLGMICGMLIGGLILFFGSVVAQWFLLMFLTFLFFFFRSHFEQERDKVTLKFSETSQIEWKKIFTNISSPEKVSGYMKNATAGMKEKVLYLSKNLQKEIKKIPEKANKGSKKSQKILEEARLFLLDILAKENEVVREKVPKRSFHIQEMREEIGNAFHIFGSIFKTSSRFALWWVAIIVMFFSFWDTMAVTFQPIFLESFQDSIGMLTAFILPLFILPLFFLQLPFSRLADKIGLHLMVLGGIGVSAISLLGLGILESVFGNNIIVLILCGMGNATGYAMAFSPAQAKFINEMKYEIMSQGKPIHNAEISSVLRLSLNIGNVFGQVLGGFIFAFLGFYNGFLMFSILLFLLFFLSLIFFRGLKLEEKSTVIEKYDGEDTKIHKTQEQEINYSKL